MSSKAVRILIVEDEALIAAELQDRLLHLGFETLGPVDTADAAEALAEATRPDLVLMDIRLKGDRDGIAAAETIQRAQIAPVVFVTANADRATYARALDTAHFGFVVKPFHERDLRVAIDTALGRSASDQQLRRALADEQVLMAAIFRDAPTAMAVVDLDGRLWRTNRLFESLTGIPTPATPQSMAPLLMPDDWHSVSRELQLLDQATSLALAERMLRHTKGTATRVLSSITRLQGLASTERLALWSCVPIEARKRHIERAMSADSEATGQPEVPHIVVADDEDILLSLVRRMLERDGYRVSTFSDGVAALEFLRETTERVHLLITDVMMPRMSGAALTQILAGERPEMPIVLMSGYNDDAFVRTLERDSQYRLIHKPFHHADLRRVLTSILGPVDVG